MPLIVSLDIDTASKNILRSYMGSLSYIPFDSFSQYLKATLPKVCFSETLNIKILRFSTYAHLTTLRTMIRIRFGTTGESYHLGLATVAMALSTFCIFFDSHRIHSHDLILQSRGLNMTTSIFATRCGFSYHDYHCSVLSKNPNISQFCLNDTQIMIIRFGPISVYVLDLCVVYGLFSLSEDFIRFFSFFFGILSIFAFGFFSVLYYDSACVQSFIILPLCLATAALFSLSLRVALPANRSIGNRRSRTTNEN
ncbi:unnamed protein product [Adineta ricciae]|uniref:Uncharacterized protein n=1 Tax=Adineta ricciae TaxID=249248 RepID=A0A815TX92_ADIRI|nr:unnamed protein product [Adineta ricciae]